MSYPGVYAGIVKDTNDPESKGRVRVIVPEVAGTALLPWAAPAYGAVGTRTPVLNTQVWVSFKNGKVKHPVWIGYTSSVAADFAATAHDHVEYAAEDTGWITVTSSMFSIGWQNYGVSSPVFELKYRRKNNILYMVGLAQRTTSGTNENSVMYLPVGFRPAYRQTLGLKTAVDTAARRTDIDPNGQVIAYNHTDNWVSFGNVSIPLD